MTKAFTARRAGVFAITAAMTCSLLFPQAAFAVVRVDTTELAEGENEVGGGRATYKDSKLDMAGVTAGELYTDENLSVNFNGGNEIEQVSVTGSAEVGLNFAGENEVEEVHSSGQSNVTINANGHNEFEEVEASEQSNLTINVTGENEFEEIVGRDDANITIRGTECQMRDTINVGEDEHDTQISTENGTLTIDHVTVNLEGEEALVGSQNGDVRIDTSKIAGGDDNEYTSITAGGTMEINESVIDIDGTIHSTDEMTITHSDVKVNEPDSQYDKSPYRVWSEAGVTLSGEANGEVLEGEIDGNRVFFVDTDGNNGREVDLRADGKPAYYGCDDGKAAQALPKTGDETNAILPTALALAGASTIAFAMRRRAKQQ